MGALGGSFMLMSFEIKLKSDQAVSTRRKKESLLQLK